MLSQAMSGPVSFENQPYLERLPQDGKQTQPGRGGKTSLFEKLCWKEKQDVN